jgi:hypothetical protein
MKQALQKYLPPTVLLAALALSASACVVEPAYGPGYAGGYYDRPGAVYVTPAYGYYHGYREHDGGHWGGDRNDWR